MPNLLLKFSLAAALLVGGASFVEAAEPVNQSTPAVLKALSGKAPQKLSPAEAHKMRAKFVWVNGYIHSYTPAGKFSVIIGTTDPGITVGITPYSFHVESTTKGLSK